MCQLRMPSEVYAAPFLSTLKAETFSDSEDILHFVPCCFCSSSLFILFQKCFPIIIYIIIAGILRRIGIGFCCLFCSLFVNMIGHILPSGHNATSVFAP